MSVLECPSAGTEPDWDWAAARGVCLREALRVLGPHAAAEDAAQEAVVRAWRQRRNCRTPEQPAPWLATIARREALRIAVRAVHQPLEEQSTGVSPSHESQVDARVDVTRALRELDVDDRRLLAARYFQDLTQSQCAVELGIAEGTAKVRLHRLRSRMSEALQA